jgi:hypothetical protein
MSLVDGVALTPEKDKSEREERRPKVGLFGELAGEVCVTVTHGSAKTR